MKPEFIAYNRKTKLYVPPELVQVKGKLYVGHTTGGGETVCYDDDLYQFIGRKDKDGKKVYEGSLFKLLGQIYTVHFDKENMEWIGKNTYRGRADTSLSRIEQAKVIGHIAEDKQ
jgi:hypothetical protein